METGNIHTI